MRFQDSALEQIILIFCSVTLAEEAGMRSEITADTELEGKGGSVEDPKNLVTLRTGAIGMY